MRPLSQLPAEMDDIPQSSIIDELNFIDDIVDANDCVMSSHIVNSGNDGSCVVFPLENTSRVVAEKLEKTSTTNPVANLVPNAEFSRDSRTGKDFLGSLNDNTKVRLNGMKDSSRNINNNSGKLLFKDNSSGDCVQNSTSTSRETGSRAAGNTDSAVDNSSGTSAEAVSPATITEKDVSNAEEPLSSPTSTQTTTSSTTTAASPIVSYSLLSMPSPVKSASQQVFKSPGDSLYWPRQPLLSTSGSNAGGEDDDLVRAPSFSLSMGSDFSSSGVEPQAQLTIDYGENEGLTQRSVSQGIIPQKSEEGYSHTTLSDPSHKHDTAMTSSKRDRRKEGRTSLPMRISKSLGNFFQDSKRPGSLAGKLMTSLAGLGRKGTNQSKQRGFQDQHDLDEEEQYNELVNNNQRKTPIFVSPQDQKEIIESAPADLTQEQKMLLRTSWAVIKTDVADVGVETFMGLFHTHPDAIDSFMAFKDKSVQDIEQSAVLKAHALRVMQTVDKCVTRLEEVDKMATVLTQLGRRHVGYRANVRLVPMIGKQFISAIEPKMGDKWSYDVKTAWDSLFRIINYNLRLGMMTEKHSRLNGVVEEPRKKMKC